MKPVVRVSVPIAVDQVRICGILLLELLLHLKRLARLGEDFVVELLVGDVIFFVEHLISGVHDDDNATLLEDRFVVEPVEHVT